MGNMKKVILSQNAPKPIGPYNQAIQAGNFLFVSGQLPIDPKDGKIIVENIKLQTRLVMENIKAILEAAGYSLKRCCVNPQCTFLLWRCLRSLTANTPSILSAISLLAPLSVQNSSQVHLLRFLLLPTKINNQCI